MMQTNGARAGDCELSGDLQLDFEERGGVLALRVGGVAAVEVVGQLSRTLQEAAARRPRLLAVDLTGLNFISSTGLGSLVASHVACQKNGTIMVLIRPKPYIRGVLEITSLSKLFHICESLEEAEQLVAAE